MKRLLLLVGLAAASGSALAAPAVETQPPPPLNAFSIEIPALFAAGVELDGERFFFNRRWSLTLALGGQWAGSGGDYSSQTYSTGVEARVWLNRLRLWFMKDSGGPYAGVRVDFELSRLLDHQNSATTTGLALAESVSLGYRLVLFNRIEVTPSCGIAFSSDIGTLPSLVVGVPLVSLHLGGTIGYLF